MGRRDVQDDYFEWMYDLVSRNRYTGPNSFRTLLSYLHSVEFRYGRINDGDRAQDGVGLRHRFASSTDNGSYKYVMECLGDEPCSILEMILALAIRCEEDIMDNPRIGDRTGQWFWKMITNLGLGGMTDEHFDGDLAEDIIQTFLDRKYASDGRGGLFYIRNVTRDVRRVSIWVQMMWFLDTMI